MSEYFLCALAVINAVGAMMFLIILLFDLIDRWRL